MHPYLNDLPFLNNALLVLGITTYLFLFPLFTTLSFCILLPSQFIPKFDSLLPPAAFASGTTAIPKIIGAQTRPRSRRRSWFQHRWSPPSTDPSLGDPIDTGATVPRLSIQASSGPYPQRPHLVLRPDSQQPHLVLRPDSQWPHLVLRPNPQRSNQHHRHWGKCTTSIQPMATCQRHTSNITLPTDVDASLDPDVSGLLTTSQAPNADAGGSCDPRDSNPKRSSRGRNDPRDTRPKIYVPFLH